MTDEDFKIERAAMQTYVTRRAIELMDEQEISYLEARLIAEKEWGEWNT